jgi:hypothetical protein
MLELKFGLPKQRQGKVEKYPDTPVITMQEYKGKGYSKKFEFNAKAQELLNLNDDECYVAIDYTNKCIVKVNGDEPTALRLTKNSPKSFSNSKVYDYFIKNYELNAEVENELFLTSANQDYNGNSVYLYSVTNTVGADYADVAESILAEKDLEDEVEFTQAEVVESTIPSSNEIENILSNN